MTLSSQATDFLSRRQPNGKQRDFFDSHADDWDEINHNDPSKLEYICGILDLKGGESVMDVGTGTGVMIPYYLERLSTGHVTAVDFSPAMIRKASEKYPSSDRLDYLVADVCELPPSERFDLIVCYSCFPHFPDPRVALRSMVRTLRKGGKLAIVHSSSRDFINDVHRNGGEEISKDFLPPADIMSELFLEQGLETVFSRDDEDYYIVIGIRARFDRHIRNTLVRTGQTIIKVTAGLAGMAFDGRASIVEIDEEEKTVIFDIYRYKKITGTKVGPILGLSDMSTPFKIACELAGLYPGDKTNKYIEAGNILEPVLREYLAKRPSLMREALGLADDAKVGVEEPVPREMCGYDHFHNEKVFGGLVDGYIQIDGKRDTILEIKTSHNIESWKDDQGGYTNVPMTYMLQASLYAELSNLDRVLFLVGFLDEPDYDRPKQWVPTPENTKIIVVPKLEMSGYMKQCEDWYNEYIKGGYTPEWTDKDEEVLKYLKAYKPKRR